MKTKFPTILICGGRDYDDDLLFYNNLWAIFDEREWGGEPLADGTLAPHNVNIIAGDARGADAMAAEFAKTGITGEFKRYKANWDDLSQPDAVIKYHKNGKPYDAKAGNRRNQRMLDEGQPDLVIAFPGGRGTADMVWRAKKAGIEVIEIE